jgi:hypothetical protein
MISPQVGEIKTLCGQGLTQEWLAEAAGLSVATIGKAERDLGVGLLSLLRILVALHADVLVVLGGQELRRPMTRSPASVSCAGGAACYGGGSPMAARWSWCCEQQCTGEKCYIFSVRNGGTLSLGRE